MRFILCILLLTCLTVKAATTYHVATNGSDAAAGTLGAPFLTIQKGANVATNAGDTVLIHRGLYSNDLANCAGANCIFVQPKASGLPGQPITFQSYGDGEVILWGMGFSDADVAPADGDADGETNPSKNEYLFRTYYRSNIVVSGLTFANSQDTGVEVDGAYNIVTNCLARDCWRIGFALGMQCTNNVFSNKFSFCEARYIRHHTGFEIGIDQSATNMNYGNIVENCISWRNGYVPSGTYTSNDVRVLPISGDAFGGGNSDGFTIYKYCADNVTTNSLVSNYCPSNTFRGLVAFLNSDDGFDISGTKTLMVSNISINNGPTARKGFKMLRDTTNTVWIGNVSYRNQDAGFEFRSLAEGVFFNNTAIGNLGKGFVNLGNGVATNNLSLLNGSSDIHITNCFCGNNWAMDGSAASTYSGNPKLVNTNLFYYGGTNVWIDLPAGTIQERWAWIVGQVTTAFTPASDSTAIDIGLNTSYYDPVTAVTTSWPFYGVSPDIGAYDYLSVVPTITNTVSGKVSVSGKVTLQ